MSYFILGDKMNITILDNNLFIVKINSDMKNYENITSEKNLKELLYIIRKRYNINIYGFYDIKIYEVNNIIKIIHFIKKDDDEFYRKIIDLNILKYKKNIDIVIDDFTLISDYEKTQNIKLDNISKREILRLCEHYDVK